MDVRITPKRLTGTVTPPSSKSMAHRAILAAALSMGTSTIRGVSLSQDIEATLRCVGLLGCDWKQPEPGTLQVRGIWGREWDPAGPATFDCGESGSTLRFLIPVVLALEGGGRFTGQGRLMERPQEPYFAIFREKGVEYGLQDGVLTLRGELAPGEYRLPGNVSSQFVTGLLYALHFLESDSRVVLTSPLESGSYVEMTVQTLASFGVRVEKQGSRELVVPGDQFCQARDVTIEGDWSQGAFWYAAMALGNPVEAAGLREDSVQGDRVAAALARRLSQPGEAEVDLADCPDLLPPLAVMAAARQGTTRFTGAARLRLKESDRLATVHAMLTALGCRAEEGPDSLTVVGGPLAGGRVDGAGDHRIVMAAAIAATACGGPVTITGAQAVEKSYPAFWQDYKRLGGDVCVL